MNSLDRKYYTISDFISAKLSLKNVGIFHLNIASLQKHIDELRTLLMCTNSNFDVICISETRLHNEVPLSKNRYSIFKLTDMILFIPRPKHNVRGLVCILKMV